MGKSGEKRRHGIQGSVGCRFVVSFLTNTAQLKALLPERFEVAGKPVVTVAASYITELEWLAGRGYHILGVSFPATFQGEQDQVTGNF
jgi:hypothetical protein